MTRRSVRLQNLTESEPHIVEEVGDLFSQPITRKERTRKDKIQKVDDAETERQKVAEFWKAVEDPDPTKFFEHFEKKKKPQRKSHRLKKCWKGKFQNTKDDTLLIDKVEEGIKENSASSPSLNVLEEVKKVLEDSGVVATGETLEKLKNIMESSNENNTNEVGDKDKDDDASETKICNGEEGSLLHDRDGTFSDQNDEEEILSDHIKNPPSKAEASQETIGQSSSSLKRKRGPTKCNSTLLQNCNKVYVEFNGLGQPIGKGSVSLSSFLGPLVREIVPYSIDDWRKVPESMKNLLWAAIQEKYQLDQLWQKEFVMKEMGELWRASKSRLVAKVREAQSVQEQMALKPNNTKSTEDWKQFIKVKTSDRFKAKSKKFKEIRNMQFPHTSSRKGYARLTEEMKQNSTDPSDVKRGKVWIKAHTKKNGLPINTIVAETIDKMNAIEEDDSVMNSSSVVDDALSKVLGPEKRGRIRALGKGVSLTKLQILQQSQSYNQHLQDNIKHLEDKVANLTNLVGTLMNNQGQNQNTEPAQPNEQAKQDEQHEQSKANKKNVAGENLATDNLASQQASMDHVHSSTSVVNTSQLNKPCKLLDWVGECSTPIVAEGRWSTNDPKSLVHHVPLGPNAVRVWVDVAVKRETYLWRPTSDMTYIEDAIGTTIAWPKDKILLV